MSHRMYPNSTFCNRDRHFSVTEEKSISMMASEANEALLHSENEKSNGKSFKIKAASFSTISARQDSGFSGDIDLPETSKITKSERIKRQSSVFRTPDSGTGSNEPITQDRSPLQERPNSCWPLEETALTQAAIVLPQIEEQRDNKTSSASSTEWIKKDEGTVNENNRKSSKVDVNSERHLSSGQKTFFIKMPRKIDRQTSILTREGTQISGLDVANATVPELFSSRWKRRGDNSILAVISALYAKILVVMGLAFPMTEVISNHVTSSSYLGFYLYLYFGCILYFLYVFFITVIRKTANRTNFLGCRDRAKKQENSVDRATNFMEDGEASPIRLRAASYSGSVIKRNHPAHHGSFYLRIGAVAFGVGSMIYSGLEFAQYFEESTNPKCHNVMMAITPAGRMFFSFFQMYFIFLNSKMSVCTHKSIAYFGLMHMVATNLCVWLNVIIEETKHEILHFIHHNSSHAVHKSNHDLYVTEDVDEHVTLMSEDTEDHHDRIRRLVNFEEIQSQIGKDIIGGSLMDECKRSELMGNLVQDVSPLLFPCAIEYSLISAAILYVMWKNVVASESDGLRSASITSSQIVRRSRHHYSVDCAKANKGLFAGIFILVLTIISLTLFFALINHPAYTKLAIMEVGVSRFVLFCLAFIATIIGIIQVRELRFDSSRSFDLDDVLLIFGQLGLMAYNIFTVIAAYFTLDHDEDGALVLLSALAALFQAMAQTLFILDASRRNTFTADQQQRKPGREVVTFLLVCNFAMWTVNTLEKSRADVNPVQLNFYGLWPWIIIMNVSMPLAIFYRFHSTVVLCEIWKRCYKAKPEF